MSERPTIVAKQVELLRLMASAAGEALGRAGGSVDALAKRLAAYTMPSDVKVQLALASGVERCILHGQCVGLTEESASEVVEKCLRWAGSAAMLDVEDVRRRMTLRALGEPWEPGVAP